MISELIVYGVGAYVVDVVIRPEVIAQKARRAARARGKPLLNVGAGTPGSSLRVALLGHTAWGDVNTDLNGRGRPRLGRPGEVIQADVQCLPFPNGFFGAAIASHVLEHVDNPRRALRELSRVADEVYVITPVWWAPHTWLHPGHRWHVTPDGRYRRLW